MKEVSNVRVFLQPNCDKWHMGWKTSTKFVTSKLFEDLWTSTENCRRRRIWKPEKSKKKFIWTRRLGCEHFSSKSKIFWWIQLLKPYVPFSNDFQTSFKCNFVKETENVLKSVFLLHFSSTVQKLYITYSNIVTKWQIRHLTILQYSKYFPKAL